MFTKFFYNIPQNIVDKFFQDIYIIIECSVTLNLQILLSNAHYDYSELPAQKTDMRLTIVVKKYIGFNSSYMVTSIEYKKFSRETIADYKQ